MKKSGKSTAAFWLLFAVCALWFSLARAQFPEWRPIGGTLRTRAADALSPTNVHAEYPRPQLVRRDWLNLNGLWEYAITRSGVSQPTNYQGQILVPFPVEAALSGVGQRLWETNALWYRRQVHIPESWAERRVRLHIGAVDWHARVFVNGQEAGRHRGGYDGFSLDITEFLNWSKPEEIVVVAQDPTEGEQPRGKQSRNPEGIFYTPSSGIWQTVWMEPVPRARIDGLRLTPDLSRRALKVNVIANRIGDLFRAHVVALQDGVPVARAAGPANAELELQFENPRLWSPRDPFLYDLQVTLVQEEQQQDYVESYFGLRELTVRKDKTGTPRLALNGEFLFQIGVLDQGFWPDGLYTAPDDAAFREDLLLLKELGFNTVRKHVKVEPERWYYWCDRLGLLVWQDMPSGNNLTAAARNQFEIELQRMVEGRYNHPSIVLWVLFNEGWGQYDTARLAAWLKKLDPSRLVNAASGWIDKQVGDVADVHSYPGPEAPAIEGSRALVLGEFGGVGLAVKDHVWSSKIWGYEIAKTPEHLTSRCTDLLKRVWTLHDAAGLSAVIYTQLSDVETECNGLITYDRAVVKMDKSSIRSANLGELRDAPARLLVAPAGYARAVWRYTVDKPNPRWNQRGFDMSRWGRGRAGFGLQSTSGPLQSATGPLDAARTVWNTPEIWLRRLFVMPSGQTGPLLLQVRHSGDAEIYLNGVLAARVTGQSDSYTSLPPRAGGGGDSRGGNQYHCRPCPARRNQSVHRRGHDRNAKTF